MKTDDNRDKELTQLTIVGIIILIIGLLIALVMLRSISYDYNSVDQYGLLRDLSYVVFAGVIELFGIGLIIVSRK
jgi:hypothetical protein